LAFNSNDDPVSPLSGQAEGLAPDATQSEGARRFSTCRWQQPAEDGNAAFCTHREVKPYAGMASFDADAWCADCEYYKLRRVPKRRPPEERW
jgi:hypothetical protein